ncbi:MAG: HPr kinase/phosphatase C-terminal domain-containing protein [Sulfitobacter sp.]
MDTQHLTLHASCVAVQGKGVLITGPSGSGKSALALWLLALGGELAADDRTILSAKKDKLIANAPPAIAGMIEARGVGILPVASIYNVHVRLVVDMAQLEVARLPQSHTVSLLDITLPCLHKVDTPYFPAAIHTYLRGI